MSAAASDDSIEISFANGVSIGVDVGADRNFYMRVKWGDIQILKNLRVKYKEIPQKIKEFLAGKVKPMTIISGDNVYIDGNKLWWNCTKVAECPKVVYGEIEERGEALFFSVGDKRVKLREISDGLFELAVYKGKTIIVRGSRNVEAAILNLIK